ncbi:serine/threonine protein kinase [Streptomyces vinaceus]|uniref:serine/threonine protein kinase n=1 Tax=Streptomyces vinaceus TaxID=1960 RepID=UPI00368927C9
MGLSGLRADDPKRVGELALVGRLGAGGMGVVYLAQGSDGRLVALKRLREELASDPEFRARFRREAATLLRVQGTCTARVLAVEAEASTPFLVMEYVQGPTLAEHMGEHGPLGGEMARVFAVGLAEALVAFHRAGVVHRDLKPGNVLLSDHGPKVIDFGIAQAADATALTRAGVTVGTVGYMAPEQVRGQAGPPADVFAWALTVAYAATGRHPFGTGPTDAVLYRVLHEEPDLDGVPPRLKALLSAALDRSPERRPAAGQLLAELTGGDGRLGGGDGGDGAGTIVAADAVSTMLATAWRIPVAAGPPTPLLKRRTTRTAAATSLVLLLLTAGIMWTVLPGRGNSTASNGAAPARRAASQAAAEAAPSSSRMPSNPPTPPATRTPSAPAGALVPSTPAVTGSLPPPPPAAASTGPIANTHSGLCVDTNGPQRPGLDVELRACGNYSGQIWRYDETSLSLTNTPSGLCLDTAGRPVSGVTAVVNPCGYYSGQQWRYDAAVGRFTNPASGLCLDTNGPPAVGLHLTLNPCGNYTGQYWRI